MHLHNKQQLLLLFYDYVFTLHFGPLDIKNTALFKSLFPMPIAIPDDF